MVARPGLQQTDKSPHTCLHSCSTTLYLLRPLSQHTTVTPPHLFPASHLSPTPPIRHNSLTLPVSLSPAFPLETLAQAVYPPIRVHRPPPLPADPVLPPRWLACRAGRPLLYGIQIFFRGFWVNSRGDAIPGCDESDRAASHPATGPPRATRGPAPRPRPSSSGSYSCPSSRRPAPVLLGSTQTEEALAYDYACPIFLSPLFRLSASRPLTQS